MSDTPKPYNHHVLLTLTDRAVAETNRLVLAAREMLSDDSDLYRTICEVDHLINGCQDHLRANHYSEWIGVQPPVRIPCTQCANRDNPEVVEATTLAPRVLGCPTPEHPERTWTFEYVAICDACRSDWWGTDRRDRPTCAPPFMNLPDEWVGC